MFDFPLSKKVGFVVPEVVTELVLKLLAVLADVKVIVIISDFPTITFTVWLDDVLSTIENSYPLKCFSLAIQAFPIHVKKNAGWLLSEHFQIRKSLSGDRIGQLNTSETLAIEAARFLVHHCKLDASEKLVKLWFGRTHASSESETEVVGHQVNGYRVSQVASKSMQPR